MKKISFYGRRVLKWNVNGKEVHTISGQWVGHAGYGDSWGTPIQRENAKPTPSAKLIGISNKILWNYNGYVGEEYQDSTEDIEFIEPNGQYAAFCYDAGTIEVGGKPMDNSEGFDISGALAAYEYKTLSSLVRRVKGYEYVKRASGKIEPATHYSIHKAVRDYQV